MPLPQASADFYNLVQRLQVVTITAGRKAWSRMGQDFDPSWTVIEPSLVTVTSAAQLAAATAATNYVPTVLHEQGIDIAPEATVRPQAFAGVASDGRSLSTLLEGAVRISKRSVGIGHDGGDALAMGQRWLDMALQTIVTDAARDATAAEIITRPHVKWVRVVNPPCCARCAVLANGVHYWNKPLPRHPRCDCQALPTTDDEAQNYVTKPRDLFDRGLITDLTKAQRKQIDGGADLVKVLNQSRDRWRARMTADRRTAGPADPARPTGWNGGGTNPPPTGTTVHELMARLTDRVLAVDAMRATGIAK